ncbi:phosphoribosyltransferase [Citricoccus sp. SGAir0253]|uniref:phosphoribosyltransferase n=1 Tax=Citricoccus sp. SGAir0253 TaxID=2567881 RepID=UPI0010CD2035|nr:phosphoribosyltransferase family protein [Citricoccus sp. SGAir0253]QCU79159.1 phosphoribosyltransferase [Citricoccus sp. SGAir0253]
MPEFTDRYDAGAQLAARLAPRWAGRADVVVLGLPRGGVPVAEVVARELGAPLDVIMVRKLGVPAYPELAMGAIGEHGVRLTDEGTIRHFAVTAEQLRLVEQQEHATLERRAGTFRAGREPLDLRGKTAVIIDDGMATGATARVACRVARQLGAAHVVLALPVASRTTVDTMLMSREADEIEVLATPRRFRAVGEHYRDFSAVDDARVAAILGAGRGPSPGGPAGGVGPEGSAGSEGSG